MTIHNERFALIRLSRIGGRTYPNWGIRSLGLTFHEERLDRANAPGTPPLIKVAPMKLSPWLRNQVSTGARLLGRGAAIVLLLLISLPASAADLKVIVDGIRSSAGSLMIGLYDSDEHFQKAITDAAQVGLLNDSARLVGISMRAISGMQSAIFTNLQPGTYALIVFHDENDNGKLDANAWGVPTEGYGFSNNAEGFLGAPSFKDAAVTLHQTDKTIEIRLNYPIPASEWLRTLPSEGPSASPEASQATPP